MKDGEGVSGCNRKCESFVEQNSRGAKTKIWTLRTHSLEAAIGVFSVVGVQIVFVYFIQQGENFPV